MAQFNETNDPRFLKLMNEVFNSEGRVFTNRKGDPGGRTMWGLTQIAYDQYCNTRNLPHRDVSTLNENEIRKVYYEDFYKFVGADKVNNIASAYALFDTAVNFNPWIAQKMYKKSDGDFYKMLDIRRKEHKRQAAIAQTQERKGDLQGWLNRCNKVEKVGEKLFVQDDPNFFQQLTPFDQYYEGALKNIFADVSNEDRVKKRTQYLIKLKQKGYPTGLAASIDKQLFTPFKRQQIGSMDKKEYSLFDHIITNQLTKGIIDTDTPDIEGYINNYLKDGQNLYTSELANELRNYTQYMPEIELQNSIIGLPNDEQVQKAISSSGDVQVRAYTRADGTQVRAYTRSRPD